MSNYSDVINEDRFSSGSFADVQALIRSNKLDRKVVINDTLGTSATKKYLEPNDKRLVLYIQNLSSNQDAQLILTNQAGQTRVITIPFGTAKSFGAVVLGAVKKYDAENKFVLEQNILKCEWENEVVIKNPSGTNTIALEILEIS